MKAETTIWKNGVNSHVKGTKYEIYAVLHMNYILYNFCDWAHQNRNTI